MNHRISNKISSMLLGTVCLAGVVSRQDLTPPEREQALRYLAETRDGVVEAVKGLSDAQWRFKPAPDRWSVAEVVEHLALIEEIVHGILLKLDQAPAAPVNRDIKKIDAQILSEVPDRSTKVQAPPQAVPTGRWTPAAALDHYLATRAQITAILRSAPDLRQHVVNHPVLGQLDGYEWILAVAAHSARHTKQILEVKADPHFPAN